jgi:hypothetical protein
MGMLRLDALMESKGVNNEAPKAVRVPFLKKFLLFIFFLFLYGFCFRSFNGEGLTVNKDVIKVFHVILIEL